MGKSGEHIYHIIIDHTIDVCCKWLGNQVFVLAIQLPQNMCVFLAVTAISKLSSVRPLREAHGEAIYML